MDPALRAVLDAYPKVAQPLAAPEHLGNAGGASGAVLWRFRSGRGWLVARAWPPDGPDRKRLAWVHERLSSARGLGFVPVPERDRHGETIQEHAGRLWELAPWMPGSPDLGYPPALARLRAGFTSLATFHEVMWRESRAVAPSPGLKARLGEIRGLRRGGFSELQQAIERAPASPNREPARRWLTLARPQAGRVEETLTPWVDRFLTLPACLRDPRPEHLLFEGDRLTGLVDFGAMGCEVVSADLARLLAEWVGPDRAARTAALDAYEAVRPLDADEMALIAVFEQSAALLGPSHWVRWHFVEGRTFDNPAAVTHGLARGLARLEALQGIL